MRTTTRTPALLVLTTLNLTPFASAQPEPADTPPEPQATFRHTTLTAEDADGTTHDYAYAVWRSPALNADDPAPAILFLHGYGECGTDGVKQTTVGLPPALVVNPDRWPFVVIIPQKPVFNSEWEDHETAVLQILDLETNTENIDPDRIAITGLSQGGHGTITLAARYPDRFSAVAPVCGYTDRWIENNEKTPGSTEQSSPHLAACASALVDHPVWIFHGGRDTAVPPSESEILARALTDAGSDTVDHTVFPDDDHNSWDSAYGMSELAEWFMEHTR